MRVYKTEIKPTKYQKEKIHKTIGDGRYISHHSSYSLVSDIYEMTYEPEYIIIKESGN